MHPRYGICEITDVLPDKYVLKPKAKIVGNPKIFIHKEKMSANGVRYPVKEEEIEQTLDVLRGKPQDIAIEAKYGYAGLKEKILGGDTFEVAEAARDLYWFKGDRNFSEKVRDGLLELGIAVLMSEFSYVKHISSQASVRLIDKALARSKRKGEKYENSQKR